MLTGLIGLLLTIEWKMLTKADSLVDSSWLLRLCVQESKIENNWQHIQFTDKALNSV